MVNLKIDNQEISVKEGTTILEAARQNGIDIPTLCFLKEINEVGDCRMCIVEVEGRKGFATSCIQKVEEGMVVRTNSPEILATRKILLDLILSNHHKECLTCVRDGNCELQALAAKLGIEKIEYTGEMVEHTVDDSSPAIVRDFNKCVLCRRCVAACKKVQNIGAIDCAGRGFHSCVSTTFDCSLEDVDCTFCGQCIAACPTGALKEKESIQPVWEAIRNPDKVTIVQTAPAVRVALGEEFGMPIGTNVTGKMVTALKKMGFDKVFDTNTGADFTIMEEATEFVERLQDGGTLPMFTSCSPAWVRFVEKNFPDQLDHLSSCKSPHQMFGAIIKSYYADTFHIDPKNICTVSIMPCVAKKYECTREEMEVDGNRDVDYVLTTRELARMLKQANIELPALEESTFDSPMGEATGAGAIFGTTGGVMEAALRTAADLLEGKSVQEITYEAVRGKKGIKTASLEIAGKMVNIAVVSGLDNARKMMEEVRAGTSPYHFIEVMSCPGGCVMGGGQPIKSSKIRATTDVRKKRADAIYSIDEKSAIRKSHENPYMQAIYKDYLGKPGGEKAHKYLHTHYSAKPKYTI